MVILWRLLTKLGVLIILGCYIIKIIIQVSWVIMQGISIVSNAEGRQLTPEIPCHKLA